MHKTEKYNSVIESFKCDFTLAKRKRRHLHELEKHLQNDKSRLCKDLLLLEELSDLLKSGKAEIYLLDDLEK